MIALVLALAAAGSATADRAVPMMVVETSLSGVARDGVLRHKPDGTRGLWIESFQRNWYYARFAGPCQRLGDSYGLRFEASPNDRLDKTSAVIADGEICRFDSFIRSGPPPKAKRRG